MWGAGQDEAWLISFIGFIGDSFSFEEINFV